MSYPQASHRQYAMWLNDNRPLIHYQTQSYDPIGCMETQWSRPMKSCIVCELLLSCTTESGSGSGPPWTGGGGDRVGAGSDSTAILQWAPPVGLPIIWLFQQCSAGDTTTTTTTTTTTGWLLYSANLSVEKTQCASTHHSLKYTHRHKHNLPPPHTHTHTHIMVRLDLWKCLLKKESFKLGFEVREGGEIPLVGRQGIPDSWGTETERTVAKRSETALRDFQQRSAVSIVGGEMD